MSLRERAEALMIGGLIGDTSAEHQRLSLTLYRLLAQGADHARSISEPKLMEMKHRVGFVVPG